MVLPLTINIKLKDINYKPSLSNLKSNEMTINVQFEITTFNINVKDICTLCKSILPSA